MTECHVIYVLAGLVFLRNQVSFALDAENNGWIMEINWNKGISPYIF